MPKILDLPLTELRPTQMEIGMTHVHFSRAKILSVGSDIAQSVLSRVLPAVLAPNGKAYITDGHHWASAANSFLEDEPSLKKTLRIRTDVFADFTGRSWEDFAKFLYDEKIGHFTREVRERYEIVSPEGVRSIPEDRLAELYQTHLPAHFFDLKDSPARSAIGIALEELSISADHDLVPYVEFFLEDDLREAFIRDGLDFRSLTDSSRVTPEVVEKTKGFFASEPAALAALLKYSRLEGDRGAREGRIRQALETFTK